MPSTRSRGRESRIVAKLPTGSLVTTHRNDVDFIVTEYGCADLRGASMRERATRLIEVADPGFRDELQTRLDEI
jgi:4-hydroxybutyrate CoA-transferase